MIRLKINAVIEVWPNGLGCDIKANGEEFELWDHGGASRLEDEHSRSHWKKFAGQEMPLGRKLTEEEWKERAAAVVASWFAVDGTWAPCEPS